MCLNARELAKTMTADEAMLLPTLYRLFVELVYSEATYFPSLQPIEENSIPGKRWVLSRLHFHFGDMLTAA